MSLELLEITTATEPEKAGILAALGLDSMNTENPFNTSSGQVPVSMSETFWSRLGRLGRWRSTAASGTTCSAGSLTLPISVTASAGCSFYPKRIILSSDVAALFAVQIDTKIPNIGNSGIIAYYYYASAGIPLNLEFDGEVWVKGGGAVKVGMNPATTGQFYGTVYGIEITEPV